MRDDSSGLRKLTIISWSVIAGLAALLAVVAWLTWPPPPPGDPPRAREYRDFDLCLLTDRQGIQGAAASQVWQGLQAVSVESSVRVSYLTVTGEQTEAVAAQFVATQVQQQCDIIVAVGAQQVGAATAAAPKYPAVKFVTVGGTATGSNLSKVEASAVAAHVRTLVS